MATQDTTLNEMKQEIVKVSKATKVLETQMAQLAENQARMPHTLPPKPDVNPKEAKAVRHTLRSGRQYEDPLVPEETYINTEEGQSKPNGTPEEEASKEVQPSVIEPPPKVSSEVPRYIHPHRYAPFSFSIT